MASSTQAPDKPSDAVMRRLVDFYDPVIKGKDAQGRTLDEILEWDNERLEVQHDYIQTLFPLPERSGFRKVAPVLDEETMLYFRHHEELKDNLRRALERMMAFYGFTPRPVDKNGDGDDGPKADDSSIIWLYAANFASCFDKWRRTRSHNHLRITRILRSLRVLGLPREAEAAYKIITKARSGVVGGQGIGFWTKAVGQPLHIAPDGTKVEWLEKYSDEREGQGEEKHEK